MNRTLPSVPAMWCLGFGSTVWTGVAIGSGNRFAVVVGLFIVGVAAVAVRFKAVVIVAFLLAGIGSGVISQARLEAATSVDLPAGNRSIRITVVEEPSVSSWGFGVGEIYQIDGVAWTPVRVALRDLDERYTVGSVLIGSGALTSRPRWVRGEPVAGTLSITTVDEALVSRNPMIAAGNEIRSSVQRRYDGGRRADGLLRGFIIGDTDLMRASDAEDLRRAGLSHYVAVSGSNVALFLAIWWFVTAPLSIHPQFRVAIGGIGLWLFAIITRWESSVIRASAMAAVPLVGGWIGIPVDPWMALGTAVGFLLLVSGHLSGEVGFQLSAFATAGVLVGMAFVRGRKPRWLVVPLGATIGAQLAVAPLLLVTFGSVPLFAPLANLVAAPVVALTTVVAAAGVIIPPAASVARLGGDAVHAIAGLFGGGPQLGWMGTAVVAVIGAGAWVATTRPFALAVGSVLLVAVVAPVSEWPTVPQVTVLDVGQGDATLIQDPGGASLLFDGGSHPAILERALRRRGVRRVGVVVVSHGDDDHVGGLSELVERGDVGTLVASRFSADELAIVELARRFGVPVETVAAGDVLQVGGIRVEVLSPSRRFLSDNDGSLVLYVNGEVSVLLPGDVEAIAQNELPDIRADVILVPHHGSSSTDVSWLESTMAQIAILSYGPNRYGHPDPGIIRTLEGMETRVIHTATDGDVDIPLKRPVMRAVAPAP